MTPRHIQVQREQHLLSAALVMAQGLISWCNAIVHSTGHGLVTIGASAIDICRALLFPTYIQFLHTHVTA